MLNNIYFHTIYKLALHVVQCIARSCFVQHVHFKYYTYVCMYMKVFLMMTLQKKITFSREGPTIKYPVEVNYADRCLTHASQHVHTYMYTRVHRFFFENKIKIPHIHNLTDISQFDIHKKILAPTLLNRSE